MLPMICPRVGAGVAAQSGNASRAALSALERPLGWRAEIPEAIGEVGGVGGLENGTVAGQRKLAVDDVVPLHGGFARGVVLLHVFQAGFENVNHALFNLPVS